jgi:hypothetical protein
VRWVWASVPPTPTYPTISLHLHQQTAAHPHTQPSLASFINGCTHTFLAIAGVDRLDPGSSGAA